ncbi:MAG: hypothetical protein QOH70_833 [Blastocatellia bacterium]|nr:hypothetical protein [Blastocatellia bacterium]
MRDTERFEHGDIDADSLLRVFGEKAQLAREAQ